MEEDTFIEQFRELFFYLYTIYEYTNFLDQKVFFPSSSEAEFSDRIYGSSCLYPLLLLEAYASFIPVLSTMSLVHLRFGRLRVFCPSIINMSSWFFAHVQRKIVSVVDTFLLAFV